VTEGGEREGVTLYDEPAPGENKDCPPRGRKTITRAISRRSGEIKMKEIPLVEERREETNEDRKKTKEKEEERKCKK